MKKSSYLNVNKLLIYMLAVFVMFLPRRIYIANMYSFRFVILGCFFVMLLCKKGKFILGEKIIGFSSFVFFTVAFFRYLAAGQIISGIGYMVDTLILFVLFINVINNRQDLNLFIGVFTACMAVYSMLGIVECFTGFNLWNVISGIDLSTDRYGFSRSYGACTNFTNNAMFLFLSLPAVGWKIMNSVGLRKKLCLFTYVLIIGNILATLTRMAILCVLAYHVLILLKFGLLKYIAAHLMQILAAIAVIAALIYFIPAVFNAIALIFNMFLALFSDDAAASIAGSFGGNENGVGHRLLLYSWVWDTVKDHAIFGVGPNVLFTYNYVTSEGTHMVKESIENQYLMTLYRFGVFGLSLYVIMIGSILKKAVGLRTLLHDHEYRVSPTFRITATAIIYMASGFSFAFADDFRMFFLLLGMLYTYVNTLGNEDDHTEMERNVKFNKELQ